MKHLPSPTRRTLAVLAAGTVAALALAGCSTGGDTGAGGQRGLRLLRLHRGRTREGRRDHVLVVDAVCRSAGRGFPEGIPQRQGQAGERRDQQRGVHQAAERDQGGLRRPGCRADRVLRLPAVRLTDAFTDLSQYGFADFEDDYTASTWNSVTDGDRDLRPAAGLRPHGAVLQQDGCSTPPASPCPPPGRVLRGRQGDPRGEPRRVHHQRHGRCRLRDLDDLAGRRKAVRDLGHRRHDRPAGRRVREVGPRTGTASSRRTCSHRTAAGATSGSAPWATAASPAS